jgi:HSP20 family molecular chaperone IbpA
MSLPIPSTSGSPIQLDPKQLEALDAPLIALTQQCGGDLRRLMFAYFSFLNRRTDFYLVPHPDDVQAGKPAKMGFKEGDAEKLLLASFRQFPLRRIPSEKVQAAKAAASKSASTVKDPTKQELSNEGDSKVTTSKPEPVSTSKKMNELIGNMSEVELTEEGLQKPVGSGGSTKRYKWTQKIDECSVLVGVPEGFKAKDLDVCITANSISVASKKPLPGENSPREFVKGMLVEKIRADESTWSLEGGVLILTLDKLKKTFWASVIDGDEKIDTSLVDSRLHISEYDELTQAQIRKVIFDQNQERRGLETSDQILGSRTIPALPPGVEYIDKKKLDESEAKSKAEK